MEEYYTSRYAQGTDAWTMKDHDEVLVKFLPRLTGGKGNLDFFLPLCGKSAELVMLADQGHRVTGAEWSETAIQQFFEENKLVSPAPLAARRLSSTWPRARLSQFIAVISWPFKAWVSTTACGIPLPLGVSILLCALNM